MGAGVSVNPLVRARLEVLGAAFLFSTGGAAIKAVEFSSWQIAGLRSGVAAVAVWLLIPASRQLRRGTAGRTLLVALAYAATLTLFVLANRLTTAANTIFLQATAPIYIVLFGPLLLREHVRPRDLLFMASVAAGMALFFVGKQNAFATAPDPISGNILAAFSGVTYGCLLMGFRWLGTRGGSTTAPVAWGNLLALLFAVPNLFPLGTHGVGDWSVILYLGVFQIGLAYYLLTRAMTHLPALEVSLLLFLEPALNPLLAWLVHGEYPGRWALAGGVIIMAATALKTVWESRPRSSAAPA